MYYNGNDDDERIMRQRMRQMRHDLAHAEHERAHAIKNEIKEAAHAQKEMMKQAIKNGTFPMEIIGNASFCGDFGKSSPRTVDGILDEIDSYISYLEDLPKEKVAPYEEKLGKTGEHLKSLKDSLKK